MSTLAEFAADLARRSDAQLARLLLRRPDAMSPPVTNIADLATRLTSVHSISLALESLNLPALQTLARLPLQRQPFLPGLDCLPTLHELALVIAASSADDAEPSHYLPLTAVTLALGNASALESGTVQFQPPTPQLMPVSRGLRNNAAGSAIESLLRHMNVLMEHIQLSPLDALRDSRIGMRTVRKLSKDLGIDQAGLSFYLELATQARLIDFQAGEQQWFATLDSWSHRDRAEQWLQLIGAWLNNTHLSGGSSGDSNRATSALQIRRVTLSAVLAVTGEEHVAPTPESVADLLRWRYPLHGDLLAEHVPMILHEMEILGITGAGSPSAPGQALVADSSNAVNTPATATALAALLPAPIEHFLIQGDLTAIAPGFLSPAVSASLRRMAVPEGQGAAAIYRFSQGSLEAALASGMRADSIREFLTKHSSTAVPQSLDYLITAADLRFNATGPLVPPVPQPQAARRRKPESGVVHSRTTDPTEAEITVQITLLRSQPTWGEPHTGESGPALVMEELRQAVRTSSTVWLRAVTGQGEVERVLVRPVSLAAGMLRAQTVIGDRDRRFSIHRIMAAETTEATEQEGAPHG